MTLKQLIQLLEIAQTILEMTEESSTWKALSKEDLAHVEIAKSMELTQNYLCEIILLIKQFEEYETS